MAVCLITLVGLPETVSRAGGRQIADGEFFFPCTVDHRSMDDPIVYPRQPGATHMHDFVGNRSTNAYSTARSLHRARTSCRVKKDKSAYWFPEVSRNGHFLEPVKIHVYYRNGVSRVPSRFPFGLKIVEGDSHATSAQPSWERREFWMCQGGGRHYVRPPNCVNWLVLQVIFPQCWDGVHLDSPDHHSHMAYPNGDSCPRSHPVAVPRVQLQVAYDIHNARSRGGIGLSSGSIYSLHADFFNAWNERALARLVDDCFHGRRCDPKTL
jgi:hypothetical protein